MDRTLVPVLTVTPIASELIWQLVDACDVPESAGVRIAAGVHGSRLELALVEGPEPGDGVLTVDGARVFLDPRVAADVEDTVLDAELVGEGRVQFALRDARKRSLRDGYAPD